ncbi:protein kinase [Candidatus Gracilibacteria bacterium]|nr:protein kinase [Candidatus Gracilibacteria bacterium]
MHSFNQAPEQEVVNLNVRPFQAILHDGPRNHVIVLRLDDAVREVIEGMGITIPNEDKSVIYKGSTRGGAAAEMKRLRRLNKIGIGPKLYGEQTKTTRIDTPNGRRTITSGNGMFLEHIPYHSLLYEGFERRRCVSDAKAAMVGALICDEADRMHSEANLIHGDIKPDNVLVSPDLDAVRIIDFDSTAPTGNDGNSVYTFEYKAPERAGGKPMRPEADEYAAGVVIHTLLTRRYMHSQSSNLPFARFDRHETVFPDQSTRRLPRTTSADLTDVIFKCLKKGPEHRYPRCSDAAKEFAEVAVILDPAAVLHPVIAKLRRAV